MSRSATYGPPGSLHIDSDDEAARRYGKNTEDANSMNCVDLAEISSLSPDDIDPYLSPVWYF